MFGIALLFAIVGLLAAASAVRAQDTVTISVVERPPLLEQTDSGTWVGPVANAVRIAAQDAGVVPRFEKVTSADGRSAGAGGMLLPVPQPDVAADAAVTLPFHTDVLGVASDGGSKIWQTVRTLATPEFFMVVLWLSLALLFVGFLVWLAERNDNDDFGVEGSALKGIGNSFWWAGVTMTTIGYGDTTPKSVPGRAIAMIWMLVSMIITASLTAYIVSSTGISSGPEPIDNMVEDKAVGIVERDVAMSYLPRSVKSLTTFATRQEAERALKDGKIDLWVGPYELLKAQNSDLSVSASSSQMRPLVAVVGADRSALAEAISEQIETPRYWSEVADALKD